MGKHFRTKPKKIHGDHKNCMFASTVLICPSAPYLTSPAVIIPMCKCLSVNSFSLSQSGVGRSLCECMRVARIFSNAESKTCLGSICFLSKSFLRNFLWILVDFCPGICFKIPPSLQLNDDFFQLQLPCLRYQ